MQNIEVKQGQSFFDVVVVGTGSITNALAMALKNNVSVTEKRQTGDVIIMAGTERKAITKLFGKTHYPATAATTKEQTTTGLDYLLPNILPMSL
ncbi:MAG: hypothetical protein AB7D46_00885 [Flavobacteriaceae bacterium]